MIDKIYIDNKTCHLYALDSDDELICCPMNKDNIYSLSLNHSSQGTLLDWTAVEEFPDSNGDYDTDLAVYEKMKIILTLKGEL
tara:strand:- start:294 stop:542 length:249 start_codon:yes stop_codon:yes gene_type:complete